MKIPPDAIIPLEKLTDYLLKHRAKDDKSKYLARGGFGPASVGLLEAEIRRVTAEKEAVVDRVREHGVYYTVSCDIVGPANILLAVKLVWLRRIDGIFTFVTLVPRSR